MLLTLAGLVGCERAPDVSERAPLDRQVVDALSMVRIRDDVELLADEERGGRVPGSPGHRLARDHLAAEMAAAGLEPVGDTFLDPRPLLLSRARLGRDERGEVYPVPAEQTGYNLLGVRPGTDPARSDEVVLLVAHYDHLGVDASGAAYNGAFDDITAVSALLELARVLDQHEVSFPRTLGFLFTDAEEDGLDGAAAWVGAPTVPLSDLVAVLSVDPIGRPILPDFGPLIVIGAERSPELVDALDAVAPYAGADLPRVNRSPIVIYGSDQDVFWDAAEPVPALWLSSGGMSFYHTIGDDPETIDYRSVQAHLGAIAQLAAHLAASDVRPVDHGPVQLRPSDLAEAVDMLDGALGSAELTDEERAIALDFRARLETGVDADGAVEPEAVLAYAEVLLYVIQELTPAHPGPIPPPFPF